MLDRYVLSGERVVVATRHHWGMLLEPVATTLAALLAVVWVGVQVGAGARDAVLALGCLWLLVAARLVWKVFEWRNEWFVATDKRLLLLYGLITHKVAMMPLTKVTDMNYGRSPAGRVLGYGQFLLESAGQDQALRQIDWVAHPEATYRQICDTLFGPAGVASRARGAVPAPAGAAPPVPPPPPTAPPAAPGPPTAPPPPVAPHEVRVASGPTQPLPVARPADDDERGWEVSDEQRAPYVRVAPRPADPAATPAPDGLSPGPTGPPDRPRRHGGRPASP